MDELWTLVIVVAFFLIFGAFALWVVGEDE